MSANAIGSKHVNGAETNQTVARREDYKFKNDETRQAENLDATFRRQLHSVMDAVKESIETIKQNPKPTALVAGGLGLIVTSLLYNKTRTPKSTLKERIVDAVETGQQTASERGGEIKKRVEDLVQKGSQQVTEGIEKHPTAIAVGLVSFAAVTFVVTSLLSESKYAKAGRKGGSARPYEDRTREELYERARELGIEGRSNMSKDDLIVALRQAA